MYHSSPKWSTCWMRYLCQLSRHHRHCICIRIRNSNRYCTRQNNYRRHWFEDSTISGARAISMSYCNVFMQQDRCGRTFCRRIGSAGVRIAEVCAHGASCDAFLHLCRNRLSGTSKSRSKHPIFLNWTSMTNIIWRTSQLRGPSCSAGYQRISTDPTHDLYTIEAYRKHLYSIKSSKAWSSRNSNAWRANRLLALELTRSTLCESGWRNAVQRVKTRAP